VITSERGKGLIQHFKEVRNLSEPDDPLNDLNINTDPPSLAQVETSSGIASEVDSLQAE